MKILLEKAEDKQMIYNRLVPLWEGSKRPGGTPQSSYDNVMCLFRHSSLTYRLGVQAFSIVKKNMESKRGDLPSLSQTCIFIRRDSPSSYVCLSVLGRIDSSWITTYIPTAGGQEYHTPLLLSSINAASVKKKERNKDVTLRPGSSVASLTQLSQLARCVATPAH